MEWIKHVPRLIFVIVYEDCQGVNALWLSSWRKVSPTGPLTLFLLFRGWCSLWHHHVWLVFYLWGNKGEQNNFINQWSDSPTCSMEGLVSYLKLDVNYWQCLAVSAQHPAVLCPDMCTALWWLARDGPGSAEGVDPVSADSKAEVSLNAFWCKGTSPQLLPCSWCKMPSQKQESLLLCFVQDLVVSYQANYPHVPKRTVGRTKKKNCMKLCPAQKLLHFKRQKIPNPFISYSMHHSKVKSAATGLSLTHKNRCRYFWLIRSNCLLCPSRQVSSFGTSQNSFKRLKPRAASVSRCG